MSDYLANRAMLASISISQWSGRRLDRKITNEVNESHGAAADAGRYNKAIIPPAELKAVGKAANAARNLFAEMSMPWRNDGSRLLPTVVYLDFERRMMECRAEFDTAVDAFMTRYPALVAEAPGRLNGMYDPDDFPPESIVRRKFGFSVDVFPVPMADDFRVDLATDQVDSIRADIERSVAQAHDDAMRHVWDRMGDVVGRMVERLNAFRPATGEGTKAEGIFRDSLVQNVRDLVELLPAFNLSGDADMARITDRMKSDLCDHDATELRQSDAIRSDVARKAESILKDMADFM